MDDDNFLNINSRLRQLTMLAFLILLTCAFAGSRASAHPADQDNNLLVNGGFEWPYNQDDRGDGGGQVAHGWTAWWYNDPGDEYDGPEYKGASIEADASRVRDGVVAQQYFKPSARFLAGLYQRVAVPANSHVRFTVWGHAWSTFCQQKDDGSLKCDPRDSTFGGVDPINMKIGVDPTGGTDPFSTTIVWTSPQNVYDYFQQFAIEADAQGAAVTVYLFANPEWAAPVINVYWDNAVLTAGGGSSAPKPNTNTAASTARPGTTQAPREDGSQWHTVQAGESLSQIAFAYGVDMQVIRDLNQLKTDTVFSGQVLLIKPAPSTVFTATPGSTGEPTTSPPPTTESVAEQPGSSQSSQLCLNLFDDTNEDGLRADGEQSLAGGIISITGMIQKDGITDGSTNATCFGDLQPGDYEITMEAPEGYHLTGLYHVPVTLSQGGTVNLNFGAAVGAPTSEETIDQAETQDRGPSRALIIVGVVVTVLAMIGVGIGILYLMYRQQQV